MKVKEVERFERLVERRCERFRVRVKGRDVMVGEVAENRHPGSQLSPSVIIGIRLMID
jgi:hypothetical protein